MKLMTLMEDMHQFHSTEGRAVWYELNNYLMMSDDPKYARLKGFRKKIAGVRDQADKEALIKYFNDELKRGINGIPFDYYK